MKAALLVVVTVISLPCYAEDQPLAKYSLTAVMRQMDTTLLLSKDDPDPEKSKFAYTPPSPVHTNIIREGMEMDRGRVVHVDKTNRTVELEYDGKRTIIKGFAEGVVTNYWIVVSTGDHQLRQLRIGQVLDADWVLASVAPTAATFTNKAGQSCSLTLSAEQKRSKSVE